MPSTSQDSGNRVITRDERIGVSYQSAIVDANNSSFTVSGDMLLTVDSHMTPIARLVEDCQGKSRMGLVTVAILSDSSDQMRCETFPDNH
ncbi:hypothetical protein L13192_07320 [Pyrenophora tritici-repentis]|uniref:Uncharacterized protein n=1 Tax=Pyrenophora tritici-repentis TaxID=45151 RepID=A0A922NBG6_9PLEO|nr:hypothetical protein Ptr86124_010210 [Pyrenophora tritici-repentis]KAI1668184.1 hypothetical protein L13192_07320 [Pyrenophora tritici-repentis]KAI1681095.1 hypothetical protein KJE20_09946 [Pyrenophora tritici-repentis]